MVLLGNTANFMPITAQGLWEIEDFQYLESLVQRHAACSGECLWREGSRDNRMGLVLHGHVKLLKETENPGHPLILGIFGPGSLVIDFAFFNGALAETSAFAVDDLEIAYLSKRQFDEIQKEHPSLGNRVYSKALSSISDQLKHAYKRLEVFF